MKKPKVTSPSEDTGSPRSNRIELIGVVIAILLVIFGVFLRFHALDERGIDGSDAVYYTSIAEEWARGNIAYQIGDGNNVYRPVVFFFFTAALKLFGHTDYAIKTMNAAIDSANIFLVFAIGASLVRRSRWPAYSAAVIYACLPTAIHMSRVELTHVLSTFFVLLSLLFFLWFLRSQRVTVSRLHLAFCGLCVGLAALTHEELLFIACGYLVFLMIRIAYRRPDTEAVGLSLIEGSILLGCTLLISSKMILLHIETAKNLGSAREADAGGTTFSFLDRAARFTWTGIATNSSSAMLFLFILAVALMAFSIIRNSRRRGRAESGLSIGTYLPAVIVLVHMILYGFFFHHFIGRVFLPLVPLVIITITVWLTAALKFVRIRFTDGIILVLSIVLIPINFDNYRNSHEFFLRGYEETWTHPGVGHPPSVAASHRYFVKRNYRPSWPRTFFDLLKHRIDETARLLITSSLMYPYSGRRVLQAGFYFGDNAIYMIDHSEPLDHLIARKNIKYVFFSGFRSDKRVLMWNTISRYEYGGKWGEEQPLVLGASYGFAKGEYTMEREYEYLKEYLEGRRAKVLSASGPYRHGVPKEIHRNRDYILFELPPPE